MMGAHPFADSPPEMLSEEDFLCGADAADPWCRQAFDDYIGDIDSQFDADEEYRINDRYSLAPSSDSMLLLWRPEPAAAPQVVGYYNTPGAVCIQEEHQGQGLGTELILATYLWCGGPPTAGLDEQMFSEAGLAAHSSAWRLGVQRGWIIDPSAPQRAAAASVRKP